MKPIKFKESNLKLLPPPGVSDEECGTLDCWTNGEIVISCWEPSEEELKEIIKTKRVWLGVQGATAPPVWLAGENPLQPLENKDKNKQ
jgi:hypothetical protein